MATKKRKFCVILLGVAGLPARRLECFSTKSAAIKYVHGRRYMKVVPAETLPSLGGARRKTKKRSK